MFKILMYLFIAYIAFSQWVITGYDEMNSKLLVINDNLLTVCSQSTIGNPEKERY